MEIKVYNENGNVRVVKITGDGTEIPIFYHVADGEVATIDIEVANISVNGHLDSISR